MDRNGATRTTAYHAQGCRYCVSAAARALWPLNEGSARLPRSPSSFWSTPQGCGGTEGVSLVAIDSAAKIEDLQGAIRPLEDLQPNDVIQQTALATEARYEERPEQYPIK